ncbi:PstS family phosphate ABC transporter substrate-binding protein [Kitasatospora sp. NPDC058406]|uniref:PstS family phosphate ABC transporter substrate-binding protein n=1 Tax=Kitasatospora sp. NPDC058406 TaxID=3346483 RepID=UPI003667D411
MRKTAAKLLAAAAIATSVVTVASGTAVADPSTLPTLPLAQDIVGVGSDTTQAVLNGLSVGYNASLPAGSTLPRLYSWDATGSSPITTKTGATSIARPNGSGAGINALNTNTSTTVDFARSSRGPQLGDPATDIFVTLGKDAVSWAAKSGGNAPSNLTTAQLKGIYECTITNWTQISATLPNATIKPFLPQTNSGTRSFFLKAIGGATSVVPGACVTANPLVQENQGTDPVLNDANAVVPYSVAHYIGQVFNGHASGSDAQGPLTIRDINSIVPVSTATPKVINSSFAATAYGRVIYNVVREAEWTATDAHGVALRAIFGVGGWICTNGGAGSAIIKDYGFLALPNGACGSTTHI